MKKIETAEALLMLAENRPIDYAHENGAWMFDDINTPKPTLVKCEKAKQNKHVSKIEDSEDEYVLIEHTDCK